MTLGALRFWDGHEWTTWVSWAGRESRDDTPLEVVAAEGDRQDANIVKAYLDDAAARHLIGDVVAERLTADLERLRRGAREVLVHNAAPSLGTPQLAQRVQPASAPVARPAPKHEHQPQPKPRPAPRTAPEPIVVEPGVVAAWWARVREAVVSDLAVHGLAYVGVVLMFAGVFGLIAFSLGDVSRDWRGAAALAAPTAFFVAGWYLRRRRAQAVAAALTVLGGAILPIVAIATFTDGSDFPPDLHGTALPVAQASVCALIAIASGVFAWRHPDSMLRFTAAPTLWLGVGVLAGVARTPIPTGEAVARPTAMQMAAILVAVLLTKLALGARRRQQPVLVATDQLVPFFAALAYGLELVLAAANEWPVVSGVTAAVAAALLVELFAHRLRPLDATVIELCLVGVGAARMSGSVDVHWMGLVLTGLALAYLEYIGRRRASELTIGVCLLAVVGSAALTLQTPAAGLAASGLCVVWLLVRRWAPVEWLPLDGLEGAAAVALISLVVGVEFWRLTNDTVALLVGGGVALATAAGHRWWQPMADDMLWRWWPAALGAVVGGFSAAQPFQDHRWAAGAAAACLVATTVLLRFPAAIRTWVASGLAVWSAVCWCIEFDVPPRDTAIGVAAAALLAVVLLVVADTVVTRHLAYVGHIAGAACLGFTRPADWHAVSLLTLATAGWLVAVVLNELRGAGHLQALWDWADADSDERRVLDTAPAFVALAGVGSTAVVTLGVAHVVEFGSPWAAVTISALAVVTAVAARFVPWRRALPSGLHAFAAVGSVGAGIATAAAANGTPGWPTVTALVAGIAITVLGPAPRPMVLTLVAWCESAVLTVLVAHLAGLAERWLDVVLAGWGAVVLLAALAVERWRGGAAPTSRPFTVRAAANPAALGLVGFLVGASMSLARETDLVRGLVFSGVAIVCFAGAMLRPLGAVSTLGHGAAVGAFLLIPTWHPLEHPWSLVAAAAVLLAIAALLREPERESVQRWDLPAFSVGLLTLAVALLAAPRYQSVAITWLTGAAVLLAIAIVLRQPGYAITAAVAALVGAADLGPGWLALALAVEGLCATAVGLHQRGQWRQPGVWIGGLLLHAAWVAFLVWRDWSLGGIVRWTGPGVAAVAVVSAAALHTRVRPHDLFVVWTVLPAAAGLSLAAALGGSDVRRFAEGLTVAAVYLAVAVAMALAAQQLGGMLRWIATAPLLAGGLIAAWAVDLGVVAIQVISTSAALGLLVCLLVVHAVRPASVWIGPGLLAAISAQSIGVLAHLSSPTGRLELSVALLLVLAAEAAVLAVVTSQPYLFLASPVLAVTAWLIYAAQSLEHDANWFTVPVGVTALVVVSLIRWIRRARSESLTTLDLALLEIVGMAFVVGASLVEVARMHLWYALLAVGLGLALAVWGVATRVVRRAGFGIGAVFAAAALLVVVPLARAVPTWHGAALWLAVAGVGAIAVLVATLLEQGRAAVRRLSVLLEDITSEWEHMGGPDVRHPRQGGQRLQPRH